MPSKVQIANIALTTYLGKGRINGLDDKSPAAQAIEIHYDEARRELLSEWPWSFAMRFDALALMATNDRPEWAHQYALPPKILRLSWVNDAEAAKAAMECRRAHDTPRLVQAGYLYSDLPNAHAEYLADVDDPTVYPPKFTQALAALLAHRITMMLTETASKSQAALDAYDRLLDEAKVADLAVIAPVVVVKTVDWAEAR